MTDTEGPTIWHDIIRHRTDGAVVIERVIDAGPVPEGFVEFVGQGETILEDADTGDQRPGDRLTFPIPDAEDWHDAFLKWPAAFRQACEEYRADIRRAVKQRENGIRVATPDEALALGNNGKGM